VNGDKCLQQIARVMMDCTARTGDLVARYGGEEFACILPETGRKGAIAIAEKIRVGIETHAFACNGCGETNCITASLGVITVQCAADRPAEEIISLADKLLYRAKASGRNRVECVVTVDECLA
jgi:diguanylate cyclase (GGDEF)-like protein